VPVTESNPVTLSAEERASLPQYRADEVEVTTEKPQPPTKLKERKVLVPDLWYTEPDVRLIVLRFFAVTALGCAAFMLSGMPTSSMLR
jgi:hypothetical protein